MMTRIQALLSVATLLIKQAQPGMANPDKPRLEGLARAIDAVAVEDWEAETMIRIAWWESGYRKEIIDCTVTSSMGARGAFQVAPRTHSEVIDACAVDLEVQARLALFRVRESRTWCERLGFRGSDVLSGYTTGKCQRGEPYARARFGDGSQLRSFIDSP